MNNLIKTFQEKHPELTQLMKNTTHSHNGVPNQYHLEDSIWTHTMLACKMWQERMLSDGNTYLKDMEFVSLVMLLHDIGKCYVRQEHDKDKNKVRFIGHAGSSYFHSYSVLDSFNISAEDKHKVMKFIAMHGELSDYVKVVDGVTEVKQEKLYKDFTPYEFEVLCIISRADWTGRFFSNQSRDNSERQLEGLESRILPYSSDCTDSLESDFTNKITLLVGLPCCGKSTWAKENITDNTVVIDRDKLVSAYDKTNYNNAWNIADHKLIDKQLMLEYSKAVKAKKDIIIDMTNLTNKGRRKFLNNLPNTYFRKAIIFNVSLEEITRRNNEREGKYITQEVYDKMIKSFSYPKVSEFHIRSVIES